MPRYQCDAGERTIMNLMLEEMSTQEQQKNQITSTKQKRETLDSGLVYHFAKKNKKASKTSHQAYQIPLHHLKDAVGLTYNLPSSSAETSNNSSVAGIMETICDHIHHGNGRLHGDGQGSTTYANCTQLDEINVQLVQRSAKAFIDQIFIGRKNSSKDGVSSESKQFSDPLDILNSNRSLFLQSLQFALRDSETIKLFPHAKFSECGTGGTGDSEMVDYSVRNNNQNEDNFSRKKVKDRYAYSSNRSSSPQPPNNIVVLRPAQKVMESPMHVTCSCSSLQSHQHLKIKGKNVKPTYFSFKEIKRRLRRALGENQEKRHWISTIGSFYKHPTKRQIITGAGDQEMRADFGSRKPSNSSTDSKSSKKLHEKRDVKSRNEPDISSTDKTVCRKMKLSYSKHRESDIFQEAKIHLSERLRNAKRSEILENIEAPRTLGRILCSPEHDLFFPFIPTQDMEHGAISTEMRFSPYKFSIKDDQTSDGDSKISETNDIEKPEEMSTFEVPSKTASSCFTSARDSPDTNRLCKEYNLNSSVWASPSHDQIARSSSSSLSICTPEEVDSIKDGEEHQSPLSVLEPLFMEDASSPQSTVTESAKGPLQPLRLDFEFLIDPKFDSSACINEEESISTYVRAVLQASGLNWELPLLTRPSPDRVLNSSLSHGEKLFSTELHHDPELLFDCVNEVLTEVYQQHFGCSPWTSYLKPNIKSFQLGNHFIDEVVKGAKCHLLPQLVRPTLDQLVGQDFAKSASWLDMRFDTEDLVHEIAEDILEESIEDTILMLHT